MATTASSLNSYLLYQRGSMEDRYDDDTVELIDYLRTMWWGKWIILGCLVVAIGLSVLFVGLRPTTYSGSTEILLREYATAAFAGDPDATVAMMTAVEFALVTVGDAVPNIATSFADNHITLSRSDAESAAVVREALAQAETVLEQQLLLTLAKEIEHLAKVTQLKQSALTAQLDILRQRLTEEQVIASVPVWEALAERIAGAEAQLAEQQVYLDTLETTEPGDLFALSPIGEPMIIASESNRKTTIAVAGFLSLMIGVLLAFFVHYLLQIHERERRAAKDERS